MWPVLTRKIQLGLVLGLVLLVHGCSPGGGSAPPAILKVGVLPDEQAAALRFRYEPLIAYLRAQMDQDVRLVIPEDYGQLVDLFGSGAVDMAYFGGATFVAAAARHGAVPLVMRDVDVAFSTYFLARAGTPKSGIRQFEGLSFAFGAELSTSGHLMPRHFLQEQEIDAENFFGSVRYSGAHDSTVTWVREGLADLGAANREVVDSMLDDGRLEPGTLRIVWETPPYADYVWAVRPGLDDAYQNRLRDAFLGLSMIDEDTAGILQRMGAGGFLPASPKDFADLRKVMSSLPQFQAMLAPDSE